MKKSETQVMCPICGSIDITKQGAAYKCQQCNTKFTVDNAQGLYEEQEQ